MIGLGRKEGVQRIDADERSPKPCNCTHHLQEVGKVADTPVAARAETIELNRHAPAAAIALEEIGSERSERCDDERHSLDARDVGVGYLELETVVPGRQSAPQLKPTRTSSRNDSLGSPPTLLDDAPFWGFR